MTSIQPTCGTCHKPRSTTLCTVTLRCGHSYVLLEHPSGSNAGNGAQQPDCYVCPYNRGSQATQRTAVPAVAALAGNARRPFQSLAGHVGAVVGVTIVNVAVTAFATAALLGLIDTTILVTAPAILLIAIATTLAFGGAKGVDLISSWVGHPTALVRSFTNRVQQVRDATLRAHKLAVSSIVNLLVTYSEKTLSTLSHRFTFPKRALLEIVSAVIGVAVGVAMYSVIGVIALIAAVVFRDRIAQSLDIAKTGLEFGERIGDTTSQLATLIVRMNHHFLSSTLPNAFRTTARQSLNLLGL